jgi:hypothetical protein
MTDGRPDPDQLLDKIKDEEVRAARGKLKIFFGASAGVGKTYAMLSAARQQGAAGYGRGHRRGGNPWPQGNRSPAGPDWTPAAEGRRLPRQGAEGVRHRRRPGAQAGTDPDGRTGPFQRARVRAIPSAGRTSTNCWRPASMSIRQSTSSTWKPSMMWSAALPESVSGRPCPIMSSTPPMKWCWSTCRPTNCCSA